MTNVADFFGTFPSFYRSTAVDQILMLAWYAEANQQRQCIDNSSMRQLFKDAGVDPPDMSVYLPRLSAKRPPQLTKIKGGYSLAGAVRRTLDVKLGGDPTVIAVSKALTDLPALLPDLAEREFLTESLNCYKVRAYRGAIVMVWNLAYDHLLRWVFSEPNRIADMNRGVSLKYPKKSLILAVRDDAEELRESEFIEAARTGKLLDKNITHILKEKLGRRNIAAHPSQVKITQHSADEMITDLVSNVILKLV